MNDISVVKLRALNTTPQRYVSGRVTTEEMERWEIEGRLKNSFVLLDRHIIQVIILNPFCSILSYLSQIIPPKSSILASFLSIREFVYIYTHLEKICSGYTYYIALDTVFWSQNHVVVYNN